VARIAQDDGSSSTNRFQMGMTNYQQLRVMHFISYTLFRTFLLRTLYRRYANSVTRFIRRPLRSIRGAVLGRCGN